MIRFHAAFMVHYDSRMMGHWHELAAHATPADAMQQCLEHRDDQIAEWVSVRPLDTQPLAWHHQPGVWTAGHVLVVDGRTRAATAYFIVARDEAGRVVGHQFDEQGRMVDG